MAVSHLMSFTYGSNTASVLMHAFQAASSPAAASPPYPITEIYTDDKAADDSGQHPVLLPLCQTLASILVGPASCLECVYVFS